MVAAQRIKIGLAAKIWILFIWSAAFYMRQVLNQFVTVFGRDGVAVAIWIMFGLSGLFLFRSFTFRFEVKHLLTAAVYILVIAVAFSIKMPEERVHIIKFGILGWLLAADNYSRAGYIVALQSVAVGFFVAGIDELIQLFLPYRVGDPRDVAFGVIGALLGAILERTSRIFRRLS